MAVFFNYHRKPMVWRVQSEFSISQYCLNGRSIRVDKKQYDFKKQYTLMS